MASAGGYANVHATRGPQNRSIAGSIQERVNRAIEADRARLARNPMAAANLDAANQNLRLGPGLVPRVGRAVVRVSPLGRIFKVADLLVTAIGLVPNITLRPSKNYTLIAAPHCSIGPWYFRPSSAVNTCLNQGPFLNGTSASVPIPPNSPEWASFRWNNTASGVYWIRLWERWTRVQSRAGVASTVSYLPDVWPAVQPLPRPRFNPMPRPGFEPVFPLVRWDTPAPGAAPGENGWPEVRSKGYLEPGTVVQPVVNTGYRFQPPRRGEKEKKVKVRDRAIVSFLQKRMHDTSEALDALDAIYDALPYVFKKKDATPQMKATLLFRHYRHLDVEQAVLNLIKNHVEDAVLGRAAGKADAFGSRHGIIWGFAL